MRISPSWTRQSRGDGAGEAPRLIGRTDLGWVTDRNDWIVPDLEVIVPDLGGIE